MKRFRLLKQGILAVAALTSFETARATDDVYQLSIQPLLAAKCIKCHGSDKQQGGLRLDIKSSAIAGGDSKEPAIDPVQPNASLLIQRVTSADPDERMPPDEPLSADDIDLLTRWVTAGAEWPDDKAMAPGHSEMKVTDEDREHWSFKPRQAITLPQVRDRQWGRTPLDLFIRAAQEAQDLSPAPAAELPVLIRRLYFDVIGLPPELSLVGEKLHESRLGIEIDTSTFLDDPKAIGELVDRLLASKHYGERWARHWLDVARYADSNGQEGDADRPNAYHFRDFVIQSLNEDLPYDSFVRWQLAGDEIEPNNARAIAATGFIVAGNSTVLNVPMEEEKLRNRANELDDMVSTTAQAFLGLTLACARCHDHKYDPLPTRDYYRMMCAFNGGDRTDVPLASLTEVTEYRRANEVWQHEYDALIANRDTWLRQAGKPFTRPVLEKRVAKFPISDEEKNLILDQAADPRTGKLLERFRKELKIADGEYVAALPPDLQAKWKELELEVKRKLKSKPTPLQMGFAFSDFSPQPRETWLFERGDFLARNERVELGFLTILQRGKSAEDYWSAARLQSQRKDSSQQRRALADWITDTQHGAGILLARVMVNRIWQHHFGEGLVYSVSDFGTRGDAPTHPELLEWLTGEFIDSGWSLKHLHRLMLNSATYRQSSTTNPLAMSIDPANRLLWRQRPFRLESEALRDAMLTVAGTLNLEMYGASFKPPIPAEAMQARNVKNPYPRDITDSQPSRRRSVYMFHKRVVQYPLMLAFDAPDAQVSCGRRVNTTVAPQALALLNDPFVRLRSTEFMQRLRREAGEDTESQLRLAFQLGLARQPTKLELLDAEEFLTQQAKARRERVDDEAEANHLALSDFCQMLFSFNEFIYVD